MAPVTKKRRTDNRKISAMEVASDSVPENFSTDEVEDKADGSEMESSGEDDIETPNANQKERKQRKRKGADGGVSEKEKAQAVSDMYEYKSNVFRMETEELLKEVRLNYQKRMAPVERVLHRLKSIIEAIPESLDIPICEAEKEMNRRKINIPFPDPKPAKDVMYKFSYAKPSYINIVGGYALKTLIKQSEGFSIDLIVSMPSNIFQEKDYLNYRYFHKRAYYLANLAAAIQESKDVKVKLTIDYINEDLLRPILVVSPSGNGDELDFTASKCSIRLIPAASRDTFAINKLLPSKNCVRVSQTLEVGGKKTPEPGPTTSYNSSLLADTTYFKHLSQLHSSSEDCASFKDACVLGRVWLHQRGFGGGISKGGFGHFEWAILMSFLLKGGDSKGHAILSQGYNNYQMFKAIIQFLATRDLVASPLIFNAGEEAKVKGSRLPLLFDGSNGLNLLFKMTPWSYKLLKHEATMTMKLLNDTTSDNFDAIFLNKVDELHSRFDSITRIPISQATTELGSTMVSKDADHKTHTLLSYSYKLYDSLARGLGDRVSLIHLILPSPSPRSINLKSAPEPLVERQIIVGFMLDANQCARAVDHGPPAEHKKEAAEYRKFWGPKAELRRFKDGSILESVVWTDKDSKLSIFNQIIQYIIERHIGPDVVKDTVFIGDEFVRLLPKSQLLGSQSTTSFQPAMNGFDMLVKDLRALEGLPLQVRQISAAAPSLRYSTVEVPLIAADGQYLMEPADVVVQFESSLKWPEDLVAVQKAKIAFLLKIAELLEQAKGEDIVTRVGLENEGRNTMNSAFLDVVYLTGATFRVRIYHDRERNLLERQLKDKSLSPRTREEITQALSEHCRSFIYGPLHTQDLQKLCHRFPALSPTIRLVKKWFHSHLLSSHISDELVELITLRCFINPSSWATPSSVMTGFLRTISFISQWDWRTEPLIVDMSIGDLGASAVQEIIERFDSMRKNDPALNKTVLFAASNHSQEGTTWTENGPIKVVATRMTALARSACELVKNCGSQIEAETLFTSSMKDYDFVLQLNPAFTAGGIRKKKQQPKFKNLQKPEIITIQDISKLGLDPVKMFLSELSNLYGHNLIIFYDCLVGVTVGCLWSPLCTGARGWKVNLTYSTSPIAERSDKDDGNDAKLVINKKAILNEIARLGGELVKNIEVNRP
ncbi:uncharacterized protein H6S33_008947 [Morchella sextelata]|uniref:uncharacterized protein n=1 Tax=Morchella sextelata TaxID=1174677 RepID=UPI001D03FE7B|nr:uncharacterized protein H6S33_008947 [Morchella sextelata]KAH0612567.1 hypothetical protein H6S33_008947 [Morchella sextelata]